jgi:hypothetical protein
MHVFLLESKSWEKLDNTKLSKEEIKTILLTAGKEASQALGYNPQNINIVFKPNLPYVRERTGVGGSAFDAEMLDMTFDPSLPYGVGKCKEYLRDGIFHEINHVVHYAFQPKVEDILFWVVAEGLAVVFERLEAGANHPWNVYENDVIMRQWFHELKTASDPNSEKWYTKHPDGRTNIAYKTGAWIVDVALKNSNKSIKDLTRMNYQEIIAISITENI